MSKQKIQKDTSSEPELRIGEHLPKSIYTDVSKACAEGLIHENWDAFSQYVTEQTIVLDYKEGQAEGGLSAFPSLSLACSLHAIDDVVSYEIRVCKFTDKPCLTIKHLPPRYAENILFHIVDGKVTHIIRTPQIIENF